MKKVLNVFVGTIIVTGIVMVAIIPFAGLLWVIKAIDYWITTQQVLMLVCLAAIPSFYITTKVPVIICNYIWKEPDDV